MGHLIDRTPPSARAKTRNRVTRTCVTCGVEFAISPSIADRYTTCSRECSSVRRAKARRIHPADITCERCGKTTPRTTFQQRYCSNDCRLDALNDLPRQRGEGLFSITISAKGYRRGATWDGDERRTVLEHRYIMEQHLGRRLLSTEVVHHINGDRLDNRLENLRLFSSQAEHLRVAHPDLQVETAKRRA